MANSAHQKSRSLELLEESLQILRSAGAPVLLRHWTGALPFAVALLNLIHDAGLSWGATLLLRDSLACAMAFVWLSFWKSQSSRAIFALLSPEAVAPVGWFRGAVLQTIFQSLKLPVMPLAALSLAGWPAVSIFFRAMALEPSLDGQPVSRSFQRALALATQRYKENAVAFLAIAALSIVVWLNVLVTIGIVPSFWKTLTGYETDWNRMGPATFFGLVTVAGVTTWLLMDPWIQTYCLLRIFYQNARSDGRDLLREIARIAALVMICLIGSANPAHGAQPATEKSLSNAIDRASQSNDYGWLRPQKSAEKNGFLEDLAQKMKDDLSAGGKVIERWWKRFTYWLRDKLRDNNSQKEAAKGPPVRTQELRWTLAILAVFICGGVIALFFRKRKISSVALEAAGAAAIPDVLNDKILPSDVNQEEWLRLAFEYLENHQTRLSARAFYLANLSYLGTQSLLSLALSKSNRLYERELARRPQSSALSPAFAACNRLYERAWFGMRELPGDQMETMKRAVVQLRQHG